MDLPRVLHPVAMPSADREDAMKVMITRDGTVYFDSEQIRFGDLPAKIQDRLKDREVERRYISSRISARGGAGLSWRWMA